MLQTALTTPDDFDVSDEIADAEQIELDLERKRLRASLFAFVEAAWPIVEPTQPFVDNWHIREIIRVLESITFGTTTSNRFIFNIPPGTLKSLLIMVLWPAWVWARKADKRFLTAAYGQHLTTRDNVRTRQVIESPWYQRLFPIKLVEDQNTKTRFNTSQGGWRIATSVGGVGTGEHPNYILIDDPTTAAQADSAAGRELANAWFDGTISSRGLASRVVVILVMQRLHMEDLSGHLLKRGGDLTHICFPMRYQAARPATEEDAGYTPDPRDPRTEPGQLLFPALFPEHKVKQLEIDLGEYGTSGQLQQSPAPEGGGLFKREWFKYLDVMPKTIVRRVRGWDTAATEDTKADYTVGALTAETEDGWIVVEDIQRDQVGPHGVDALIKATAEADGKSVPVREEKEGGSSGKTVIAHRALALKGWDYKGVTVDSNKRLRAQPFRAQAEAGNVYLLRGPWNEAYIRELCNFPTAKNDDQVDATSCAFNALLLEPKKRKVELTW